MLALDLGLDSRRRHAARVPTEWAAAGPGTARREDFYPYGMTWKQIFVRMAGVVDQFD